jgi:hypothetical protein
MGSSCALRSGRCRWLALGVPTHAQRDTGRQRGDHHELVPDLDAGAFAARVLPITPLSGGLKIELSVPSLGSRMRADIDWERGTALALSDGDDVFLSLRRARVFATDSHRAPS